jgi:SAM-dependent methyltransferase
VSAEEVEFDEIYAQAGANLASILWASLEPNPALVAWLAGQPAGEIRSSALVVGCGLGDDAEELVRNGYRVTAFDLSSTAIERCRTRFPASSADYTVEDLFDLPAAWAEAFDLVVEIRTLQSLPPDSRGEAVRAIVRVVAPGGRVFVRSAAREPGEPLSTRPWPLTRSELEAFAGAGLVEVELRDEPPGPGRRFRTITAVYQRPAQPSRGRSGQGQN